jgi:hypothetical protein
MSKKDEFDYEEEFFGEEKKEKHQEDSDYTWAEDPPAELTPMTYSEQPI